MTNENETVQKLDTNSVLKFILLSMLGIFLFFIPVQESNVPLVVIINTLRSLLGDALIGIVVIMVVTLNISVLLGRVFKVKWFAEYHKNDKPDQILFFFLSLISTICILFEIGPAFIFQDPRIGGELLPLSADIMSTITLAGWLIFIILKSGLVEFVGILIEPLMRPIFKLPGQSAIDCLSSFVVSPAVAIYLTDDYYQEKVYTKREAIGAASCFSTCSVGFIGVLAAMGGIEYQFGVLVICSLLLVFVLTPILLRIPPISSYKNEYVDNRVQTKEDCVVDKQGNAFRRALIAASNRSEEFNMKDFALRLVNSLKFAQRIVTYMMTIVVVTLTLVYYTPIFTWVGRPFGILFELLQLPNAAEISAAPILGFLSITLPVISISGQEIAEQSVFFVVLLSIAQIIFISEAGSAMLQSSLNIKFKDIVKMVAVRTMIAIPIVAFISHLLF
ncbi:YjiH family protein [Natranaerobius thermophilus]|nr:nucleoside recognition domain-containing protein [Natranaerobius thermophilus]